MNIADKIREAANIPTPYRALRCPKSCSHPSRFSFLLVLGVSLSRGPQGAGNALVPAERLTRFWSSTRLTKAALGAHQSRPGRRRAIDGDLRLDADSVPKLIPENYLQRHRHA